MLRPFFVKPCIFPSKIFFDSSVKYARTSSNQRKQGTMYCKVPCGRVSLSYENRKHKGSDEKGRTGNVRAWAGG